MKNFKLRMGMIGGGPGAFIGEVHRKAALMDGKIELVAGAFSSKAEKSFQMAQELCLDKSRVYGGYEEMIGAELALPVEKRIDFVSIVTPNYLHFDIAKKFLEAGFDVMCEKPVTFNSQQAKELKGIIEANGSAFGLMHNYTGYPMVKLAKDMVSDGDLGEIRKIVVQYPQGWLATKLEDTDSAQAKWRTDPNQSGAGGCVGDIGTHAENLSEYITGLKITEICAQLTTFVEGRLLDDDVNCLLKFDNGAKGILHASQISIGEENGLAIWVYGEKGSVEWHQEHPNYLYVSRPESPVEIWRRGNDYVGAKSEAAGRATRLPFGHPEAFIEAFANNYVNFADTVIAKKNGKEPTALELDFPNIDDGLRGMFFIETVVESSKSDKKWTKIKS